MILKPTKVVFTVSNSQTEAASVFIKTLQENTSVSILLQLYSQTRHMPKYASKSAPSMPPVQPPTGNGNGLIT